MAQPEQTQKSAPRLKALIYIVVTVIIGIAIVVGATLWVIGSAPRTQAISLIEGMTVGEYITLPDDDAYPASLAVASDGTLYTGSYKSGAVWSISADGFISELPQTRDKIGSVSALDIAPDGSLVILDRIVPLDTEGAILWRYQNEELSSIVELPNNPNYGVVLPDDIAIDATGRIYVSDRGPDRVWRFSADGLNEGVWWSDLQAGDAKVATTGLAYDAQNDAILITDGERDIIFRVTASSVDATESAKASTQLFMRDPQMGNLGLDGITVAPDGTIYISALSTNHVAKLENGELLFIAQDFRGSSDVTYDVNKDVLYVSNWNQFSLGFGTRPQLPFALDIIDLSPEITAQDS